MNEGLSTKDAKKLKKASILATSDDPKDWESARARQTDVDYKDLVRQLKAKKKKKIKESFEIDTPAHNKAKKKGKMRRLAIGNTNKNEGDVAHKKAGGPKLIGERLGGKGTSRKAGAAKIHPTSGDWPDSDRGAGNRAKKRAGGTVEKKSPTYLAHVHNKEEVEFVKEGEIADKLRKVIADMKAADRKAGLLPGGKDVIDLDVERERRRKKKIKEGRTWDSWKKAAASALKRKKEEKKAQPATDAGARARRKLKDKEHNKYVNFLHADDD